jgi:hypothetical protein
MRHGHAKISAVRQDGFGAGKPEIKPTKLGFPLSRE